MSSGTGWSARSSTRTSGTTRRGGRPSWTGVPGRSGGRAAREPLMSIDIANEAGIEVDEVALAAVARFALDQMRIHPLAELSVLLVDERTMTELHERWMGEPGPTDVLAFPTDDLRPPPLGGGRARSPHGCAAPAAPGRQPGRPGSRARAARRRGAVPAGRGRTGREGR